MIPLHYNPPLSLNPASASAEGLLNFAQVFNTFYSFYEESEHGDLREHDKEETEQAVTDDMRIEKHTHQYYFLDAFSELCEQYSIAVAVRRQLFGTKDS